MALRDLPRDEWLLGEAGRPFEVILSGIIIYFVALILVRLGKSRFLGKNTALDVVMGFILGSTLSRAINGQSPLLPSIVAAAILVGLHAGSAYLSMRSDRLGNVIKGNADVLVEDGRVDEAALRRHYLGRRDLDEALHIEGVKSVADVEVARLERNGDISIVPLERARVLEVAVQEGVQTVRIELKA